MDPRRSEVWERARTVNLGPKAGSIERGAGIALDRKRNRAFIGGTWGPTPHGVARVSLQLGVVTDVIGQDTFGSGFGERGRWLAVSDARDELYVLDAGGMHLQVLDLNTLTLQHEINLEAVRGGKRSGHNQAVDKMVVDEERNRLYGVTRQPVVLEGFAGGYTSSSMWVVDLAQAEALASIPLHATTDFDLDRENQLIYATNGEERVIEVIDLESFQIRDTIGAPQGLVPGGVAVDPAQPYLYVYVVHPGQEYRYRDDLRPATLARIDPRTGDRDGQHSIRYGSELSEIVIDASTRTLWFALRIESLKIGLEDFNILLRGFLPPESSTGLEVNPVNGEVLALAGLINLLYTVDAEDGAVTSTIELGALPTGIAVSEAKNQVYVNRGRQGGFSVMDASGNLVNTFEEGQFDEMVVNDIADRLYGIDNRGVGVSDLIYLYELSSLRLLDIVELANLGWVYRIDLKMDPERGVMWASGPPGLVKLDMYTGEVLEEITTYDLLPGIWMMELAPDGQKAYLVNISTNRADHRNVYVFDLKQKRVVKTIETPVERTILHAVDPDRNRLYVSGQGMESHVLVVVDTEQDEIVEERELEYLLTSYGGRRGAVFDFEEGLVFHVPTGFTVPGFTGWITDLETGETQQYGEFTASARVARNRITNTVYAASTGDGLTISLGPAGTEVAPPQSPTGVQVTAGDEKVVLSWSPVGDPILAGYRVYRRDRLDGEFTRITRAPVRDTTFTDAGLGNRQTYAYYLTSVGRGNLESHAASPTVAATPVGGPTYRLVPLQPSVSVEQGKEAKILLSVEILDGFDREITLSATTPAGMEVTFEPRRFVPPQVVNVSVQADADAEPRRSEVTLLGRGDGRKSAQISVEVTEKEREQSVLTLELDKEEVPLDLPLLVSGRLFPALPTQIRVEFRAVKADTLIAATVETDAEGGYQAEFLSPFVDQWEVTASWAGNGDYGATQSRLSEFRVTSGKTRITCTSDLADDADLGWIATIKGRIYPNPGTVAVTLKLQRPDGT